MKTRLFKSGRDARHRRQIAVNFAIGRDRESLNVCTRRVYFLFLFCFFLSPVERVFSFFNTGEGINRGRVEPGTDKSACVQWWEWYRIDELFGYHWNRPHRFPRNFFWPTIFHRLQDLSIVFIDNDIDRQQHYRQLHIATDVASSFASLLLLVYRIELQSFSLLVRIVNYTKMSRPHSENDGSVICTSYIFK